MENIDNRVLTNVFDEDLFIENVVCGDAELLYLDSVLSTVLRSEA
jgi:hypothetical protein